MLVGFSNFSSRFHVHDLRPLSLDYFKLPCDFHFYTKLKHSLLRNVVLTKAGSNVTFINFLVQIPSLCSAFVHYDGLFSSYLQSLLSRVDWTVQGTEFSWSRDVVVILLKWPKSSVSESCENLGKKYFIQTLRKTSYHARVGWWLVLETINIYNLWRKC